MGCAGVGVTVSEAGEKLVVQTTETPAWPPSESL